MRAWALLALIIASTVAADLLQSHEMKRHGEIQDFRGLLAKVGEGHSLTLGEAERVLG